MPKFKEIQFRVKGRGRFPIDMLRHDACWPASEYDSGLITSSLNYPLSSIVELRSAQESICNYGPTVERWESFGWQVLDDSIQRKL